MTKEINWEIFHAYDVRGLYPQEIDEIACYKVALAYSTLFKPKQVVVGRDARESGPSLIKELIQGFLDSGVDVVDIGEITTDMLYFTVGQYHYDGGVVVSASHNPAEYNGMKLVKQGVAPISSETGLYDLRDYLKNNPDLGPKEGKKGQLIKKDVQEAYVEFLLSHVDAKSIKPFKLVANANFGFVSRNLKVVAEKLNLTVHPLNFEPDGTFPKGPPDPMLLENRIEVTETIKKHPVDFGAAWDADADRVMFFDEKGEFIPGIYTTALLAAILLEKQKGAKIIFDPRVVWPAYDAVRGAGGVPIMAKAGHSFMKDRMRQEDAIFAGELSAHYYFKDNWNADNGMIPFLLIMEHLSRVNKPLSEVVAPFKKNHLTSGEINNKVKSVEKVMDRVKEKFSSRGQEDYTDGYTVESDTWRFNLRSSNTQPLLRLNVEARVQEVLDRITKELLDLIV